MKNYIIYLINAMLVMFPLSASSSVSSCTMADWEVLGLSVKSDHDYFKSKEEPSGVIRIVDNDRNGKGIKSNIILIKSDGQEKKISDSDNEGWIKEPIECNFPETIEIYPEGDYFSKEIKCPISIKCIYVKSTIYKANLVKNAEKEFKKGNYGAAAWAYTDLSAYYSDIDDSEANEAAKNSFVAVGRLFDVKKPTVAVANSNAVLISPELQTAIKAHQRSNNIRPNGRLDTRTLKSLSNRSLNSMKFHPIKPAL